MSASAFERLASGASRLAKRLAPDTTGMVLQKFGSNLHELEPISRHDAMSMTKSRIYLKHVFGRMLGGDLGL